MEQAGRSGRAHWCRIGLAASVCVGFGLGSGSARAATPASRDSTGIVDSVARADSVGILYSLGGPAGQTVTFADTALPPVQVIHGLSLPEIVISPKAVALGQILGQIPGAAAPRVGTVPQTIQIVRFADDPGHSVMVVRGGAALVADHRNSAALPDPRRDTSEVVTFARAGEAPVTIVRGPPSLVPGNSLFGPARGFDLARVAFAVDGAESSHGTNPGMWRADLSGPQGPMQVSAAAALDVGGGDRFDTTQNRALGEAYLARLYARYGDWPDAIAAYNWGPGNMDLWIALGRPAERLPSETQRYLDRVLRDALIDSAPSEEPM